MRPSAISLLFVAALVCVLAVAQTARKVPRVAYVYLHNLGPSAPFVDDFRGRLAELGWHEGRNISVDSFNAYGDREKLASIMRDVAASKVDVILAVCTPEAKAAAQATSTIPIVFAAAGDVVKAGLVDTLGRPGRNVTGLTSSLLEMSAKRMELLKDAFPNVSRATVVWNPDRSDNAFEVATMKDAADVLGMQLDSHQVRDREELELALDIARRDKSQALTESGDTLLTSQTKLLVDFAAANRIPAIYTERTYVDAGGLMSYGPNLPQQHRRAAEYVDKILRGAKPADLPVEQPAKFELVINMKTAKSLGLTIPQSLLLRADEVIQ